MQIDLTALDGVGFGIGSKQINPDVLKTVAQALEEPAHAVGEVPENDLVAVTVAEDYKGDEVATFAAADGSLVTVAANDDGTQTVTVVSGDTQAADGSGSTGSAVNDGDRSGEAVQDTGASESVAVVTEDGQLIVVKFDEDDGDPDSTNIVIVEEGAEVKSVYGNNGADAVGNNGTVGSIYLGEGENKIGNNGAIGTITRVGLEDGEEIIVNDGSIGSIEMNNAPTVIFNNKGAQIENILEQWPQTRPESETGVAEEEIQITNRGEIGTLNLSDGNDTVDNDGNGHIETVVIDGANIKINNNATIEKVDLNSGRINNKKQIGSIEYIGRYLDHAQIKNESGGEIDAITVQGPKAREDNFHGEGIRIQNQGTIGSVSGEYLGRAQINNESGGDIDTITVQDPNAWKPNVNNEGVKIQNRGTIGSVSLGNGADRILNSGEIGNVDMGEGNDVVVLSPGRIASLTTGKGADQVFVGSDASISQVDTGADQDFVFVKKGGKIKSLETGTGPDTVRNDGTIDTVTDAGGEDLYLGGPGSRVGSGTKDFEQQYAYEFKNGQLFLNGKRSNAANEDILFATARNGQLDVAFGFGGAVIHPFYGMDINGRTRRATFPEVVYTPNGKKSVTITPQTPSGKTTVGQGAVNDVVHVSNEPAMTPPKDYAPQLKATSEAVTGTYNGKTVSSAEGYFTRKREIQGVTVFASDDASNEAIRTAVYQLEQLMAGMPAEVRDKLKGLQVHLGGDYSDFYIPYLAGESAGGGFRAVYNISFKTISLISADSFLHEFGHALQDLAGDFVVARNTQTGEDVTLNQAIKHAFATATKDESGWGTENWPPAEKEYWAQGHETGLGEKPGGRNPGFNPQSPAELQYADPELYVILQRLYPGLF